MAFEFDTGVLTIPASTNVGGTVQVTGLSFQPKALIFFWNGRSNATDASGEGSYNHGFGIAVSSSSRACIAATSIHAQATSTSADFHHNAACVIQIDSADAPSVTGAADLQSMNSDGFTLVIDDQFPTDLRVSWVALGGDDLQEAAVVNWITNTTTGAQDITSVGFQPDCAIFLNTWFPNDEVFGGPLPGGRNLGTLSIGAATKSAQAVLSVRTNDNAATIDANSYCRTGECVAFITGTGSTFGRVALTQFLSNGFRVNIVENGGAEPIHVSTLCLKGGRYALGNFLTATNTTAFSENTGLNATPRGALFFSANRAEDSADVSTTNVEWSIGAAQSETNRNCQYVRSKDAVADSDIFTAIEHDAIYINGSSATAQVIEGLGDLNSFNSDGTMTLQMDDADPAQSFVWYLAFADAFVVEQVLETNLAQAITPRRTYLLAQASETDLAQEMTVEESGHLVALNQASETDLNQGITSRKLTAFTQVIEADLVQAITWAPKRRLLNEVLETELAQVLGRQKAKPLVQLIETDLAQGMDVIASKTLAPATETDLALGITSRKLAAFGQIQETDLARAFTRVKSRVLGQALDTELAQAFGRQKAKALAQVIETDLAQAFNRRKAAAFLQVIEAELAQLVRARKSHVLAQNSEANVAQALARSKARTLAQVSETEIAQALTRSKRKELQFALETQFVQAFGRQKAQRLGDAIESDIAQALALLTRRDLGQALETDLVQAVRWAPKIKILGQAVETDVALDILASLVATPAHFLWARVFLFHNMRTAQRDHNDVTVRLSQP